MLIIVALFDSHELTNDTFRAKTEFVRANPCTIGTHVSSIYRIPPLELGGFEGRRCSGNGL